MAILPVSAGAVGRSCVRLSRMAIPPAEVHPADPVPGALPAGRDPQLIGAVLPLLRAFNRRYLRLRVSGTEHLRRGPVLYISNHNGGIMGPDLFCTLGTLWDALGPENPLYAMAHDFAMRQFQALGRVIGRFGALRAHPEHAAQVLAAGGQVLCYPGGDLEAYRHTSRRDEIVLGERTGFVRVAQRCRVPIVPIVVHGAHRSGYIFTEGEALARRMNLPRWGRLRRFPVALALPWGLAVGPWLPYLPLPFPIGLRVLPPMPVGESEDPVAVRERVRVVMQGALLDLRAAARSGPGAGR